MCYLCNMPLCASTTTPTHCITRKELLSLNRKNLEVQRKEFKDVRYFLSQNKKKIDMLETGDALEIHRKQRYRKPVGFDH